MSSENESSTSNKEAYICQNPELSNIEEFKKFCSNRLKSWDLLVVFIFIGSGLFLSISSCYYIMTYYPEYGIKYLEFLFSSPWISYLFIICLIGLIIILRYFRELKANLLQIIYYILIILCLLFAKISIHDESSAKIWVLSLFICGIILILLDIPDMTNMIYSKWIAKKIETYCEYLSGGPHTAIILPLNSMRLCNFPGIEGITQLAKILFERKNEPFRLYFSFSKEDVREVIINPNVRNIWIFGHGSKGAVEVTDGPYFYNELTGKGLAEKGYIRQYHCNGYHDEKDSLSLVDILTNPKYKPYSTDTGFNIRWLMDLPCLKQVKNTRNSCLNKREIKKYFKIEQAKILSMEDSSDTINS